MSIQSINEIISEDIKSKLTDPRPNESTHVAIIEYRLGAVFKGSIGNTISYKWYKDTTDKVWNGDYENWIGILEYARNVQIKYKILIKCDKPRMKGDMANLNRHGELN
jgi:hypothetical protein